MLKIIFKIQIILKSNKSLRNIIFNYQILFEISNIIFFYNIKINKKSKKN